MILRIELSWIISSPSLATGTMAWAAGAGVSVAALDLMDAARAAAAEASVDGVAGAFAGELAAAWTSFFTIRPAGPEPETLERFTPRSAATLRARGDALMRSRGAVSAEAAGAGAIEAGAGVDIAGVGAAA